MDTPWGPLPVSDAHVHFFSHRFFVSLAQQRKVSLEALEALLNWRLPPEDPAQLALEWNAELDRYGIQHAALIASLPNDYDSVMAAAAAFPARFHAYAMVNPLDDQRAELHTAIESGRLRGLCFFPAMHRYSMHEPRVAALLELAASRAAVVFVHCGVLSVGFRKKLGLPSPFDMRYSNPIDLHALALRYPQLRFVVPHFGAGYFREALMLCDLCPNVYLDTSSSNSWMHYDAHLDLRAVFRLCLDVLGPQRLLFGTDSSYFPRGWHVPIFEAQAKALYEIGVDEPAARLIFHDNLQQLLSENKSAGQ